MTGELRDWGDEKEGVVDNLIRNLENYEIGVG